MNTYRITLTDGSTNDIVADAAFIEANHPGAQLLPEPEALPEAHPDPQPNTAEAILAALESLRLNQVRAALCAAIDAAAAAEAESGFESAALEGEKKPRRYHGGPSDLAVLAANVSASLMPDLPDKWTVMQMCADWKGEWAYRAHTAAQIQQVDADGRADAAAREARRAHMQASLAAAPNIEDAQALVWD
jgi:hypothetical protein